MFIRIGNLSEMDKEYYLKEVQPCPKFKEARQIHRNPSRVIYYFKRSGGFPPLLMEQKGLVNPPEPKPEDPAEKNHLNREEARKFVDWLKENAEKQGNGDVTLPAPAEAKPQPAQQGNQEVTLPPAEAKPNQLAMF